MSPASGLVDWGVIHWCDVHRVDHEGELTVRYQIEVKEDRRVKTFWLRVCNDVAVHLGLTTRDVIPSP